MNASNIKVSVSLICYNQEDFLPQCIESILAQKTDFRFEIVISDDCSADSSLEIIKKFKNRCPDKIRVIERTQNLGLVENAMDTIGQCKGEYIALMEGDDYWIHDHKLQLQADFLDEYDECSLCFTNSISFRSGEEPDQNKTYEKQPLPKIFDAEYLLRHSVSITNNTKMFRRSCHPGQPPGWIFETTQWDYVLHLIHLSHGKAGYLHIPTMAHRRHADSHLVSRNNLELLNDKLKTKQIMAEQFSKSLNWDFGNYSWVYSDMSIEYFKLKQFLNGFRYFIMAFAQSPVNFTKDIRNYLWKLRH